MPIKQAIAAFALFAGCVVAGAQRPVRFNSRSNPRTELSPSARKAMTVDPDLAILHIGFVTQPSDAKALMPPAPKPPTTL